MLTIMPAVAAAVVVSLSSVATLAQDYPRRPLRLIAPFPPGGGVDFLARIIGQKMTENWDQQVVIDNRSGGSGIIGMEIAARAAPDGYTILMSEVGTLSKATPVTTPRSGLACWCPKRQPNLS